MNIRRKKFAAHRLVCYGRLNTIIPSLFPTPSSHSRLPPAFQNTFDIFSHFRDSSRQVPPGYSWDYMHIASKSKGAITYKAVFSSRSLGWLQSIFLLVRSFCICCLGHFDSCSVVSCRFGGEALFEPRPARLYLRWHSYHRCCFDPESGVHNYWLVGPRTDCRTER